MKLKYSKQAVLSKKSRYALLPPQFCKLFVLNSEVHHQNTRNKNLVHSLAYRINATALGIRVYGVPYLILFKILRLSRFSKKICKTYLLETSGIILYKTTLLLVYYFTSCQILMLSRLSYTFLRLYSLYLNYVPAQLII